MVFMKLSIIIESIEQEKTKPNDYPMKLDEAKKEFVQAWGMLGTNWGVSRTMAQVHALLLVSPESLSTEAIMEELQISRGNANMTIRDLIDWGLVRREVKRGERKEFFSAEKNITQVAMRITRERRKRELEPLLNVLQGLDKLDDGTTADAKAFKKTVKDIQSFATNVDSMLEKLIKADDSFLFNFLTKLLK
jgi:DNA-binding transcriptional regulator GbsR (MarR family)